MHESPKRTIAEWIATSSFQPYILFPSKRQILIVFDDRSAITTTVYRGVTVKNLKDE